MIDTKQKSKNDKPARNASHSDAGGWQMINGKSNSILLIFKWLIGIIIFLFLLVLLTSPLRSKAASDYVKEGDNLLLQKKYISAEVEYQKALTLNSNDAIAKDHLDLANKAAVNISEFERFFDLPQFAGFKAKYEEALEVPANQSDVVKLSKKLIEDGEYQLAIIPAKNATEMDSSYRDAWLYLGIANMKTAQFTELKPETQNLYLSEAKKDLNKVLELDPENQTAKELLDKL